MLVSININRSDKVS